MNYLTDIFPRLTFGPERPSDGFPEWVEFEDEVYDTPDYEQIREWVFDSVVEALDGTRIEPDGITWEGSPSWLLVLGLV
jgi:hypothetical protein